MRGKEAKPLVSGYTWKGTAGVCPSIMGAFINIGTNELIYIPVPGLIGPDQFTYTITDGRGGSASAEIFVDVRADNYISGNMLPLMTIPGGFRVGFAGIPGRTYALQRAPAVTGPWATVATLTVGSTGVMYFDDTNAPPAIAFYRTVYP